MKLRSSIPQKTKGFAFWGIFIFNREKKEPGSSSIKKGEVNISTKV
jgi:hypothetical protein